MKKLKLKHNTKYIEKIITISIACLSGIILLMFRKDYMISYVPTESMEPYIMHESIVLTENNAETYEIGDIAIYKKGDINIIHRITDITDTGLYIFKGDNNKECDTEPVSREQIKGKYLCHSRTAGSIYKYLMMTVYIAVILAGIWIAVSPLIKRMFIK